MNSNARKLHVLGQRLWFDSIASSDVEQRRLGVLPRRAVGDRAEVKPDVLEPSVQTCLSRSPTRPGAFSPLRSRSPMACRSTSLRCSPATLRGGGTGVSAGYRAMPHRRVRSESRICRFGICQPMAEMRKRCSLSADAKASMMKRSLYGSNARPRPFAQSSHALMARNLEYSSQPAAPEHAPFGAAIPCHARAHADRRSLASVSVVKPWRP
jgi:hypothetical protein